MLKQSFDLALESGVGKGGIPDAAFEQALPISRRRWRS
jgi:glucose-6-phosphate isomerase